MNVDRQSSYNKSVSQTQPKKLQVKEVQQQNSRADVEIILLGEMSDK